MTSSPKMLFVSFHTKMLDQRVTPCEEVVSGGSIGACTGTGRVELVGGTPGVCVFPRVNKRSTQVTLRSEQHLSQVEHAKRVIHSV